MAPFFAGFRAFRHERGRISADGCWFGVVISTDNDDKANWRLDGPPSMTGRSVLTARVMMERSSGQRGPTHVSDLTPTNFSNDARQLELCSSQLESHSLHVLQ